MTNFIAINMIFFSSIAVFAAESDPEWTWNTGQTRVLYTILPQAEFGGGIIQTPGLSFGQVEIRDPSTGLRFNFGLITTIISGLNLKVFSWASAPLLLWRPIDLADWVS